MTSPINFVIIAIIAIILIPIIIGLAVSIWGIRKNKKAGK